MKQAVAELSGVMPIVNDMYINTCFMFTDVEKIDGIPKKNMPQKKIPGQTFDTFPVGLQLQGLWYHPNQAEKMCWCEQCTKEILEKIGMTDGNPSINEDVLHGKEYLNVCQSGKIKERDLLLIFSIDGAQLYESMSDHSPDQCYPKKVRPPWWHTSWSQKKTKNLDSFIFPGLHHLCTIQAEGLAIWDGALNRLFTSSPFLFIVTTNGPRMAFLTGLIGHHGKMGCRLYCGLPG
ncbi:hypothetical protein F4604DRAFT_1884141 [Suillus subluteus]|nr:hypothetical protein F4604DRAFT_1884141 [Suillus subluteus]